MGMTKQLMFSYYRIKRLKNGASYPQSQIEQAVAEIEGLRQSQPEDFFELVKLCRFTRHEVSELCQQALLQANLLDKNNEVKDIIRDIILSSVIGRTLKDVEVTSPLQEDSRAKLLC